MFGMAGESHLRWRFQHGSNGCRAYAESEKVPAIKCNTLVDSQRALLCKYNLHYGEGRRLLYCLL